MVTSACQIGQLPRSRWTSYWCRADRSARSSDGQSDRLLVTKPAIDDVAVPDHWVASRCKSMVAELSYFNITLKNEVSGAKERLLRTAGPLVPIVRACYFISCLENAVIVASAVFETHVAELVCGSNLGVTKKWRNHLETWSFANPPANHPLDIFIRPSRPNWAATSMKASGPPGTTNRLHFDSNSMHDIANCCAPLRPPRRRGSPNCGATRQRPGLRAAFAPSVDPKPRDQSLQFPVCQAQAFVHIYHNGKKTQA